MAHPEAARLSLWGLAPVALVILLLQLVLSDGGRDAQTLTLVQTAVFGLFALLVLTASAQLSGVARALLHIAAVVAASLIWSVRPEATVRELLLWALYVGIIVITASTLRGITAARRFVDALVVIAGWTCLVALFNHWGAGHPGMRWSSTFYWPNPFAGFLLLVLPVEVARMVTTSSRREALAHGVMAALLAVSLVLTYSRGAWLALAVALAVGTIALRPPSWRMAARRSLVVAAGVAAAAVLLTRGAPVRPDAGIVGRAASIADAGDQSISGRVHFWRAGWRIFRDHPLTGTGAGTFAAVHPQYQQDVRYYARDPHSLYVQMLAELGVAGGAAIAAGALALFASWSAALRAARGKPEYALMAGIGLGLLAFLLHSGVEMNWSFPAGPALASALAGVLAWYASAAARGFHRGRGVWRLPAAAALLVAVALVQAGEAARRDYVAGLASTRAGQHHDALAHYGRAVQWNPLSARYRASVAAAAVAVAPPQVDLALGSLRRAQAIDSRNAAFSFQMASMLMLHRRADPRAWREAEALLDHTIALDPVNWPEAYRALARLYLEAGRRHDAARVYAGAVERYGGRALVGRIIHVLLWPDVAALTQEWASFLAADGRAQEAISVLEALLAQDAQWVSASADLMRAYRRMGRYGEARRVASQALDRVSGSEALWTQWRTRSNPHGGTYER